MSAHHPDRLKRLPPEYYQGDAWVHWILTIEDRRTGWLDARLMYRFRELLTHAAFRYQIACPIYCLMPDHIHLLWTGLAVESDQMLAMRCFRKTMNDTLKRIGFQFQRQPFDHVLQDDEREQKAIEEVVEYVARNPERKKLLTIDGFAKYPYTGCLLPGAPLLKLFQSPGWDEMWTTLAFLRRTECFRKLDPKYQSP
jgi:REP element-mobilizing transposase RayT